MATQTFQSRVALPDFRVMRQPRARNSAGGAGRIEEEFKKIAGIDLQVFKMGVGSPLLLLHGLPGSMVKDRFIRELARRFTLYMPTHPGFGKSGRVNWIGSPGDLAAFYTWYLEAEGLEGIPVIGFSLGGQIVAEVLAITGQAFSKAMLVGPGGLAPLYFHNPKLLEMLSRVRIPTQIVWGANDATLLVRMSQIYHQAIPGSGLTIIEEAGHNPQKDQPEEFLKVAADFFSTP